MLRPSACFSSRSRGEMATTAENMPPVRPILVVQVEDGPAGRVSATRNSISSALRDPSGRSDACRRRWRTASRRKRASPWATYHAALPRSSGDSGSWTSARRVLQRNLSGWDCPRAEVMMSFPARSGPDCHRPACRTHGRTPLSRGGSDPTTLPIRSRCRLPRYGRAGLSDRGVSDGSDPEDQLGPGGARRRKAGSVPEEPARRCFDAAKEPAPHMSCWRPSILYASTARLAGSPLERFEDAIEPAVNAAYARRSGGDARQLCDRIERATRSSAPHGGAKRSSMRGPKLRHGRHQAEHSGQALAGSRARGRRLRRGGSPTRFALPTSRTPSFARHKTSAPDLDGTKTEYAR